VAQIEMKKLFNLLTFLLLMNFYSCSKIGDSKNSNGNNSGVRRLGIIGGKETSISKYPYQGGYLFQNKLKCGSSIISKHCFLTAGEFPF
jgi:hypothetical protein